MQSSHPGRGGEPRATVGSRPVLPCRPRKPFQAKRDDPLRRDPAMEGARPVTGPGGCRTVDAGFAPTQRTSAVASLTDRVGRLGQSGGRPRRQRAGRPATSSTPRAAHPAPDGRTRTAVAVGRPPSLRCAPRRRLAADSPLFTTFWSGGGRTRWVGGAGGRQASGAPSPASRPPCPPAGSARPVRDRRVCLSCGRPSDRWRPRAPSPHSTRPPPAEPGVKRTARQSVGPWRSAVGGEERADAGGCVVVEVGLGVLG